jgi:ribosomal silencing factor RsfS
MLVININVSVLCGEVIAVCSGNSTKHVNALSRLNVGIFIDKHGGK